MTEYELIRLSMDAIADLITACRIATDGKHEVVWLEDHFACRRCDTTSQKGVHLIYLLCVDINEGLPRDKWNIIRRAVRSLVAKGVIK